MDDKQPSLLFKEKESLLLIESERLKTFGEWPNELSWACTPQKLAHAGFYFSPGPESLDNVCCLFCQKELDGWEPDDDPLKEHKKHSATCPFLSLKKPVEKLTLVEFVRLNMKIASLKTIKILDKTRKEFEEQSNTTREEIIEHINQK
ncbi:unnamed protein product [Candidula unifasciata]|uniref:Baculoviral IAP repeat-containing protein 5 n=1 Tax=Candidula unifasciata TaxID=100452 RepID=A0A8S3Z6I4_9EUPU|nr:unnamed protein product [Candidula unifasciata]